MRAFCHFNIHFYILKKVKEWTKNNKENITKRSQKCTQNKKNIKKLKPCLIYYSCVWKSYPNLL